MDLSTALPVFVITLREGVEATLVVGIVLAYLGKAQQTHLYRWVWGGVLTGVLASVGVGALFQGLLYGLETSQSVYAPIVKPLLEAGLGVVAIALLSWMLIWMTQQARRLKSEVESAVGQTLAGGTAAGWGIFSLIFFAVLREGFETVIFIAATAQKGWMPLVGAIAGISGAVAIGILLFQLGIRINLRLFFMGMGIFLLLIVAGLVVGALRHFDIALALWSQMHPLGTNFCQAPVPLAVNTSCILGGLVWDTSQILPARQFPGIILHTLFGYEDKLYWVQAISYGLFILTVGGIYLQRIIGWKPLTLPKPVNEG
jgi:high-affinity iron transporter